MEWKDKNRGKEYRENCSFPLLCVKVLSSFIVQEGISEESKTVDARKWGARIHEARKEEQTLFGEKLRVSLWKFTVIWHIFIEEKSVRIHTKY